MTIFQELMVCLFIWLVYYSLYNWAFRSVIKKVNPPNGILSKSAIWHYGIPLEGVFILSFIYAVCSLWMIFFGNIVFVISLLCLVVHSVHHISLIREFWAGKPIKDIHRVNAS